MRPHAATTVPTRHRTSSPGRARPPPASESSSSPLRPPTGGDPPYTYQWHQGDASGFEPVPGNAIAGATTLVETVAGLSSGTTYYFRLVATDGDGETVVYEQVAATPLPSLGAGTATATAGIERVSLDATAATGGVAPYTYQWHSSTTAGFTPSTGNVIADATSLSETVSGLVNGTTYYFRLVATDAQGASVTYDEVHAMPQAAFAAGSATATAGVEQIALEATAPSGGALPYSYQWHREVFSGFTPAPSNALAGFTSRSEVDTDVADGTVYYYRLVATDLAGESVVYPLVWAEPHGAFYPGDADAVAYEDRVELRATAAIGGVAPIAYQWFRSETQGFTPSSQTLLTGATALEATDANVTTGVDYYYRLVATDAAGATIVYPEVHAAPGGSSDLHGMWVAGDGTYLRVTPDSIVHYYEYPWPDPTDPSADFKLDCYDATRFEILSTEDDVYTVRYHRRNNNQDFFTDPMVLQLEGDQLTRTYHDTTVVYTRSELTPEQLPECRNADPNVVCSELPQLHFGQETIGTLGPGDYVNSAGGYFDLYGITMTERIESFLTNTTSTEFPVETWVFDHRGFEYLHGISYPQAGSCYLVVVTSDAPGQTGEYRLQPTFEPIDPDGAPQAALQRAMP